MPQNDALGQKLLALTAPGVPDVYQGTELWDDSLVDPDNRRPVDYDARREALKSLQHNENSGRQRGPAAAARPPGHLHRGGYHPCSPREPPPTMWWRSGAATTCWPRSPAGRFTSTKPVGVTPLLTLPDGSWTDALTGRRADRDGVGR